MSVVGISTIVVLAATQHFFFWGYSFERLSEFYQSVASQARDQSIVQATLDGHTLELVGACAQRAEDELGAPSSRIEKYNIHVAQAEDRVSVLMQYNNPISAAEGVEYPDPISLSFSCEFHYEDAFTVHEGWVIELVE
jgi:hypothetical protein